MDLSHIFFTCFFIFNQYISSDEFSHLEIVNFGTGELEKYLE